MSAPSERTPTLPQEKRDPDFILRSNSVSLLLSFGVLVAIVLCVYLVFPHRDQEALTQAVAEHRSDAPFDLARPSAAELSAWSNGVMGGEVPWPQAPGLEIVGARSAQIMKRRAALARYVAAGVQVTLIVQRNREMPPRTRRKEAGGDLVVSWRRGKWTYVAVGTAAAQDRWKPLVGAP
jgi:hypothetical protein